MSTKHILINGDCRKMSQIQNESVHLIVTSPPYWQLKDYGTKNQIGFNDSYEEYINNLNLVWKECHRILMPGCRLCINIGDQFARSAYYGRYKVVPIHSEIIRFCETIGFDYMGSIVWQKPTSMHTTGGEKVMGSYPYPRGGIVKIDFEHILLFKKLGKAPTPLRKAKEESALTMEEWNEYFISHWTFNGAKQNRHIAVFPEELPKRLIKMFSYVDDTICDPFMGSGTTALAAANLRRNSIGYELNKDFRVFYKEKVIDGCIGKQCEYSFSEDNSSLDYQSSIATLPYRYVDVHKIDKQVDVKVCNYGSKFEVNAAIKDEIKAKSNTVVISAKTEPTVLVNHARASLKKLMIEKGICYLRAGDSKGSLLVQSGFERMQYVLLHTAGKEPLLFKLKTKGVFQIWAKETLVENGFNPRSAPYYIVLHFDAQHPIPLSKNPELSENKNTYRPKIKNLSDFL
ncbi:MAG: site-specific DNA-methyltransferase [Bacteroidaceae bacterium]|nr:site-specific DNA-methyltransferase [Bacteroidaceae bacterium]